MLFLRHLFPLAATVTVAFAKRPAPPTPFSSHVIFDPPRNYTIPRTLYARNEQLPNGDLLATWENYSPEPPAVYFPIYRSSDHGQSWTEISRVQDTANGLGLRYQPFLYYLPERIGRFPKGTLLLAGSSIPTDLSSTQIDLYASPDLGHTWKFVSHIAGGGVAIPDNGLTPVWEPFLLAHKGKLIAYYADQRDNATHGQKLSHQTTRDLVNWSPPVDDAAYPTYTDRPGMPTVAKLPNGKYIYVYEYGSFFDTPDYSFPVYYRISSDPEGFNDVEHHELIVSSGVVPTSSPYITWTPWGGVNGTLVVSAGTQDAVFVNQALGEGEWTEVPTPEPHSYTRSLRVLKEDPRLLLLTGGGVLLGDNNKVTVSLMNLEDAMASL